MLLLSSRHEESCFPLGFTPMRDAAWRGLSRVLSDVVTALETRVVAARLPTFHLLRQGSPPHLYAHTYTRATPATGFHVQTNTRQRYTTGPPSFSHPSTLFPTTLSSPNQPRANLRGGPRRVFKLFHGEIRGENKLFIILRRVQPRNRGRIAEGRVDANFRRGKEKFLFFFF